VVAATADQQCGPLGDVVQGHRVQSRRPPAPEAVTAGGGRALGHVDHRQVELGHLVDRHLVGHTAFAGGQHGVLVGPQRLERRRVDGHIDQARQQFLVQQPCGVVGPCHLFAQR